MGTNNFLPFSNTDIGTNLLTQAEYVAAADRTIGNQPGVASAKLNNKAIRQATAVISQLAQYMTNKTDQNILDDGNLTNLLANFTAAFATTTQEYDITNLTLATSVAGSALTIAVKTKAAADATAFTPITIGMRSATLNSGVYNTRSITGALSIVVSSGSTLGQVSASPSNIYVYLIDNAGTLELAVSHSYYTENSLYTTVAEGGAGGADSATAIYSTTLRSNVPLRLIGYILNTQATAGTWASAGSVIQLLPIQSVQSSTSQSFTATPGGNYITPAGCRKLICILQGGGGGGGGGGDVGSSAGDGTSGTETFMKTAAGVNVVTAGAGSGGLKNGGAAGSGGTAVIAGGVTVLKNQNGMPGQGPQGNTVTAGILLLGGTGGAGPYNGPGTSYQNAVANTGAGGGGGAITAPGVNTGPGGGSGAYVVFSIDNPAASYTLQVGAAGSGGSGGVGGGNASSGAEGFILIYEIY